MVSRCLCLVASAFAGVLLAMPVHAAPPGSQFAWADMKVIDAGDFLSGWNSTINYGASLEFTIKNTAQAHEFAERGFRIRFFRADAAWNPLPYQKGEPIPYLQFPPCDIYLSGIWGSVGISGHTVQFGPVEDLGWLSAGQANRLGDGRWLLIFEADAAPQTGRILRLKNADRTAYFSLAAKLIVKANGNYMVSALPMPTPEDIKDIETMKAEAAKNTPSRYCMNLKTLAEAMPTPLAEPTTFAQLGACAASDLAPG